MIKSEVIQLDNKNKSKTSLHQEYNNGFLNNISQSLVDTTKALTGDYEDDSNQQETQQNKQ